MEMLGSFIALTDSQHSAEFMNAFHEKTISTKQKSLTLFVKSSFYSSVLKLDRIAFILSFSTLILINVPPSS